MNPILVVPYNRLWPEDFAIAAATITSAMGDNLLTLHHIGSTSIPDMPAKPVIDMLAEVADIAAVDPSAAAMQSLGYEVMGEFGIPGRRYFRRDHPPGVRTHQIHAFQTGSPHVARHLAFRDFMRAHRSYAEQYAELKRSLAAAHPNDMNAYMDGKDAFIKDAEAKAMIWAAKSTRAAQ